MINQMIDSEALFDSRMQVIGLTQVEQQRIRALGWMTHSTYAFSSAFTPGQTDETQFLASVVVPVLGDAAHASAAKLRRLLFESYTLTVQDMRSQLERNTDDPPRKLPQPERASRFAKLAARLGVGIQLRDGLEPSNRLVDLAIQLHDDDSIAYIPWSACTTRTQEVHGQKKDNDSDAKVWKPDAQGVVRERPVSKTDTADTASDYKFRQALSRRGIALDLAGLCSFEVHEMLADVLMTEFHQPALDNHSSVTMEQLETADKHLFTRLAEITRTGIRKRPDGTLPMEDGIRLVLRETKFNCILMQLQSNKRPAPHLGAHGDDAPLSKRAKKAVAKAAAASKASLPGKGGTGKGAAAAAKGSGKGRKGIPAALVGLNHRTAANEPICFGFALGTCSAAAPGSKCPKGWHTCMKPGCELKHSLADHP